VSPLSPLSPVRKIEFHLRSEIYVTYVTESLVRIWEPSASGG
jgi:hypothetical protein